MGYLLRIEPGLWIFSVGLVNLPFYAMEIRHHHCKDMNMIVGEIGPVEVELIYTVIFLVSGTYFGGDCFDKTLGEVSGVTLAWCTGIKVKTVVAVFSLVLVIIFTYDNIKDSLDKDAKETVRMLVPVFIIVGVSFLSGSLPSFTSETCVVYFLYQMVFAIVILKLMIFNMSGRPFTIMHIQYIYLVIPIVAYRVLAVSDELEALVTESCMVCALVEFLSIIYRLAKQYTATHNINFFTIKHKL